MTDGHAAMLNRALPALVHIRQEVGAAVLPALRDLGEKRREKTGLGGLNTHIALARVVAACKRA